MNVNEVRAQESEWKRKSNQAFSERKYSLALVYSEVAWAWSTLAWRIEHAAIEETRVAQ